MANEANNPPYERRPDGILFHLRNDVKLILHYSTSTKVVIEMWRGEILMPPDTGNINSSNFREKLARNARDSFGEFYKEGEKTKFKDNIPHILEDLGMVALAMSSPAGESEVGEKGEPTLWDLLARDNPFQLMIKYAREGGEYFHTAEQEAYATVKIAEGHRETYPLHSRRFTLWLRREWWRREEERKEESNLTPEEGTEKDSIFPSKGLSEIVGHFESIALFEGREEEVFTRVAARDGKVYVDLCDPAWRAVEISVEGWQVISSEETPVKFARSRGMLPLPEPTDGNTSALLKLRSLLNLGNEEIGERNWRLILAWLVQAFMPTGPYPVLTLLGPQGSAKSTAQRILRNIVDSNSVPLRSAPRDEHNLYIDARAGWVIALDNMSNLPGWLSDALCRLATGGGFSTRQLYTDQDQILFDAMRPVILNGIGDVVTRPDLLDRALIISLGAIPKDFRKLERDLEAEVEAAKPGILGAIFTAISAGLRAQDGLKLAELPRMADFARWGVATEQALGGDEGSFLDAYMGSQDEAVETAIETWAPGSAFIAFAKRRVGPENAWEGSATELLKELNDSVDDDALKRSKEWPKAPNKLTEALNRLAPALLEVGVHVERPAHSRRAGRKVRIFYIEPPDKGPSPPSPPSPEEGIPHSQAGSDGDDSGDDTLEPTVTMTPEDRHHSASDDTVTVGDDSGDDTGDGDRHHETPVDKPGTGDGDGGDGGDDRLQTPMGNKNGGRVVHVEGVPKSERVYIGRLKKHGGPHYFANPYKIGKDGPRDEVLAMYEERLYEKVLLYEEGQRELEILREQVAEGKGLACHCAGVEGAPDVLTADDPLHCHGQLLLRALNGDAAAADDDNEDDKDWIQI